MRLHRIQISLVACMLLAASGSARDALATDYFVRKTGSDVNPGTSAASAWLTVDHAADSVAPGDTIYVGAGTYIELVMPAVGGTVEQPIQLIADTDGAQTGDAGEVVLAAPAASSMALYIVDVSYIQVYDFKITGGTSRAIYWNNSDGGILDNCEITGSSYYGLYVYRSELNVRNCNIHDNGDSGIYVPGSSGKNTLLNVTDCTIGNNSGTGASLSTQYVTVNLARCTIQNNATYGIWANGAMVTASNCLITGTTGIDGVYGRSSCNVALRNCTIADNNQSGVYAYSGGTIVATNCVIATNGQYGLRNSGGTITHTYNLLHGNTIADFSSTSQDATEIVADPQFIGNDYEIPSTSPAADAGTDMTGTVDDDITGRPRPYDRAWDIGCYEEGPIVHWKLDETSGKTAVDSSGYGNDGAYEDEPPLGQECAPHGTAVYFQEHAPSVYLGGNSTINEIESFTAACWAKSDTENWTDDNYLLSKEDGKFSLYGTGGRKLINVQIRTELGNSYASFDLNSVANLDLRNWHHYAASYDAVEGVIRLYVDGARVISTTIASSPLDYGAMPLLVNEQYVPMMCMLDDIRLYDRRLTDVEVALLYGLVGHWRLDEKNGLTAVDSTVFANDGALQGSPVWKPEDGAVDGALEFGGSSDHVDLGTFDVSGGAMSIAAWFRADKLTGSAEDGRIISKATGQNTQHHYFMLSTMKSDSSVRLCMRIRTNGNTKTLIADSGNLTTGQWTHAVAVYDGTDMVLYKDGVEVGRIGKSGTLDTDPTVPVWIGDNPGPSAKPFDGLIDDVRIYNRALCVDEIAELHGAGPQVGWRISKWVEIAKPGS